MSIKLFIKLFVFFFTFIFLMDSANAQCSMCRAVFDWEEGQLSAKGFNNGIIYLMAIPYILVALVSWKIYKIYKN